VFCFRTFTHGVLQLQSVLVEMEQHSHAFNDDNDDDDDDAL
jgi:hypothetical protein